MSRFELLPIEEPSLPEVAQYFAQWRIQHQQEPGDSNPGRIENAAYLRWLLVDNPARGCTTDLGFCIRDTRGAIAGAMLAFPSYFVWREKRLKGLCSASFFVNAEARTQGFFILKKYFNSPSQDFFFATTCGPSSAALWSKLRGRAVPNSESTCVLPYRIESLLGSFGQNRNFHPALIASLRAAGQVGSAVLGASRKAPAALSIAPCRDWEKLAALAGMHRDPECVTNERSAAFLEWRYGQNPGGGHKELYWFSDRSGNEGWFAVASAWIGHAKKIRATGLLDLVWPSQTISLRQVVSLIVAQTSSSSDALYIRERSRITFRGLRQLVIPLHLPSPRCYVAAANGNGSLAPELFDFVAADGDSSA